MTNPLRWRGHEVSQLEGFSDTICASRRRRLAIEARLAGTQAPDPPPSTWSASG